MSFFCTFIRFILILPVCLRILPAEFFLLKSRKKAGAERKVLEDRLCLGWGWHQHISVYSYVSSVAGNDATLARAIIVIIMRSGSVW